MMRNYCIATSLLLCSFFETFAFHYAVLETLEECERRGKMFCYTGTTSDRNLMNKAIESQPEIREEFLRLRKSLDFDRHLRNVLLREKRNAQSPSKNNSETDCNSVCCAIVEHSAPFSYLRGRTGWQEVPNTPEYPQRVSFSMEKCLGLKSPCRGVQSTDTHLRAQCEEVTRQHKIFLYDKQTRQILNRTLELPAGCRCHLVPVNPYTRNNQHFSSPSTGPDNSRSVWRFRQRSPPAGKLPSSN